MANTDDFPSKTSHAITKSTLFAVSKDEWDTKEATGKSMKKCIVCTVVCQKVPVGLKQCRTVKKQAEP